MWQRSNNVVLNKPIQVLGLLSNLRAGHCFLTVDMLSRQFGKNHYYQYMYVLESL